MAKVGRPKSDNPKADKFSFRLNSHTVQILDEYCKANNVSRSEAIRIGVEALATGNVSASSNIRREERSMPDFLL